MPDGGFTAWELQKAQADFCGIVGIEKTIPEQPLPDTEEKLSELI